MKGLIGLIVLVVTLCIAAPASAQCGGGSCDMGGGMMMGMPQFRAVPPVIMQPRTVMQPMYYQGSTVTPKQYATPIRSRLFGSATVQHQYSSQAPVQRQAPVQTQPVAVPPVQKPEIIYVVELIRR